MIRHQTIRLYFAKRNNKFFKLIKEINIVVILEESDVFIIASIVYVIISIGINLHLLTLQKIKLTKFLKLRKFFPGVSFSQGTHPNTTFRSGNLLAYPATIVFM